MRAVRDVTRTFTRTQELLTYQSLGMSYGDYIRHTRIAGHVWVSMADTINYMNQKEQIDVADAEFVVSYSVDAALEVENRVGSLEAIWL